jgi:5-(carboxyamino)imidazole ribonucleotide synthase
LSFPLPPGSTIGILGGGQLGRMRALAAARLGFDVAVLAACGSEAPAVRVAARSWSAAYDDPDALRHLAEAADVVTYEFENVPAAAVERLEALGAAVAPGARALAVAQDRVREKRFMREQGLETVAFEAVDDLPALRAAVASLGAPAVLKTRREGYDGKGQARIGEGADLAAAWAAIGGAPAILERRADFTREISVIGARGRDGATAVYPPGENVHEDGILRRTTAPARAAPADARRIAEAILEGLDYVGVIGVELFELPDGRLLVNEIAPRVHNSGHWTQDGCEVDQFEQHIRAIAGWPLGPTRPHSPVVMENLIGEDVLRWAEIAADPGARLHLYGKGEARPGRKMGHVNRVQPPPER